MALPPKHLSRQGRRPRLASHPEYVFESLTALAVILVAATIFANLPDRSESGAASRDASDQAATTAAAAESTAGAGVFGNLVANWSFEQDLAGWQVVGAADTAREPQGRTSGSSAAVRPRGPQPQAIGLRLAGAVPDTAKGGRYVASAWVRSTGPGQQVTIRLVGAGGEASKSTAPTLPGLAWRRVIVGHSAAAAGGALDLEVTAEGMPAGDTLLVDEVLVRQG
jgi:hypothetical protein